MNSFSFCICSSRESTTNKSLESRAAATSHKALFPARLVTSRLLSIYLFWYKFLPPPPSSSHLTRTGGRVRPRLDCDALWDSDARIGQRLGELLKSQLLLAFVNPEEHLLGVSGRSISTPHLTSSFTRIRGTKSRRSLGNTCQECR